MLRRVVVAVVYLLAAAILTWPLAANLTSHLGARVAAGDPYLNLWILGWGMHAWATDPIGVLSGRVFDANIFFPARDALTYSDHFLLQALPLAPLYALTGDAVLCYNLLLILSIALSGLAMHAFVKSVTASTPAAYLAGLAWACWPYRTAHLLHIQLQALYFLPLALLALHRLAAKRWWRDSLFLGVMAGLQAIASVYYGVMTMVALAIGSVTLAIATGQWRSKRLIVRLAVAALIGAALAAPVLMPYRRSQDAQGFGRSLYEAANYSAAARSYRQVPPDNLLYGRSGVLALRGPLPGERDLRHVEHQLFPGVVIVLLALFGVVAGWRSDARPLVLTGAALAVVGLLLSFGPNLPPLYAWLYDAVYGFQAIRAPARFTVVGMLGLAMLAAVGMRRLARERPHGPGGPPLRSDETVGIRPLADERADRTEGPLLHARRGGLSDPPAIWRRLLPFGVIALMALEYVNAPLPLVAAPPRQTPVGQWLAHEPTQGAVLHLPLTLDIDNTPFMVQSLEHWRPIVNGYSGQRPAFFPALVDALTTLPSPDALATLKELDVRFVVGPGGLPEAGTPASPFVERARFAGDVIYEVRWTPESEAALDAATGLPEPPQPVEIPFAAGETLTYEVRWDGGPVNLPAGTATLRTSNAAAGEGRWRFEVSAETADWVSSFFEARDRFVTVADAALKPLQHQREIREGRRRQDRVFVYDAAERLVRSGQTRDEALAPGALSFAISPAVRDAVTAFYYARTVVAPAGGVIQVPINEAGRNLILALPAGEEETITHRGQAVRARRLSPTLQQRIARRRPIELTVWVSVDERRVPLLVDIDAGFGRVKAELVDYRR